MANEKYLGEERVSEFWLAIKTMVNSKLFDSLKDYATNDAVTTAVMVALTNYIQTDDMNLAISTALTNYVQTEDMKSAINTALTNYMTSEQVTAAIEEVFEEIQTIRFEAVDKLPDSGESNVIYLIPASDPKDKNLKDEYLWIDGKWEKIGNTSIDLSNYWSKDELREMTKEELEAILT